MRELDGLVYKRFFEAGYTAEGFNEMEPKEQIGVFNFLRFTIKSELGSASLMGGDIPRRGLRAIDRAVARILFEA